MSTVTAIRPPTSPKAGKPAKAPSRAALRRIRRQGAGAVAIGAVAATLIALSLSHLAHGITIVTAAPAWEAWAMAIGVDLGFIALELSQITAATDVVRKQVGVWARPAIIGTLMGSAAMNAFAFAEAAVGLMWIPAVIMGVAIPGLIYALMRIGAALYIDCHSRG